MDKIQQLYDRLDAGLHGRYSEWNKLSADVLVSLSRQITAIRDAHEYLTEAHNFEPSEVDYLLSLDDPLQAVANKWMERIGDLSDFSFAMDELLRCQNAPAKKSALAQLHEKAAAVPSVPGEKSTSKLKKEEVR